MRSEAFASPVATYKDIVTSPIRAMTPDSIHIDSIPLEHFDSGGCFPAAVPVSSLCLEFASLFELTQNPRSPRQLSSQPAISAQEWLSL